MESQKLKYSQLMKDIDAQAILNTCMSENELTQYKGRFEPLFKKIVQFKNEPEKFIEKLWKDLGSFPTGKHYHKFFHLLLTNSFKLEVYMNQLTCNVTIEDKNDEKYAWLLTQFKLMSIVFYKNDIPVTGQYLAYHRNKIAPVNFQRGNLNENMFANVNKQWPVMSFIFNGLSDFQEEILDLMIHATRILTQEKLQDVSIMDLPAFGSSISDFNRWTDDWKTQTNYEVYKTVRKLHKANMCIF